MVQLTKDDLKKFKTNREESIRLVKHYSRQYKGKEHYNELGRSCASSVNGTIKAITGSTRHLKGEFLMPDTINVDKVVEWFLENRDYNCDRSVLAFYMSHLLKRRINNLYRIIRKGGMESTLVITEYPEQFMKFKREVRMRKNIGVKIVRNDYH